jgi:hypothetical protein
VREADTNTNIKIVTMIKWGVGYPADAFNRTYRALKVNLDSDVEIVCVTDDPTGLEPGIKSVPLAEIPLDRSKWNDGMWPKVALFKEDVFPTDAKVLYVDVDIAVVGDLMCFFNQIQPDEMQIIKDWKTYHEQWFPKLFPSNRGGNSSTLGFVAGDHSNIWDQFVADPDGSFANFGNDQQFITGVAKNLRYLPEGWTGSFKKSVAPLPPLAWFSACQPKPDCRIVAFHGSPELDDLTRRNRSDLQLLAEGFGRIRWIEAYLDAYDGPVVKK